MLVLSRKIGSRVVVADNIELTVVAISGQRVRLGITAPPGVSIQRSEIHVPIEGTDPMASSSDA